MRLVTDPGALLRAAAFALLAALSGQQAALDPQRAAILERAERYAEVEWTAEARHRLHGEDADGVRVDTPDAELDPGGWRVGPGNVGMPYCWGGFTSLEEFEAALSEDLFAGHVPRVGNARGSRFTLGLDCSGFVSRCWRIPVKQSTRSLGALCYELGDYDELLPGDVVNRFDAHVALFCGWVDDTRTAMHVIESARIRVEPAVYEVETLASQGFRPMRYKPLDARWQTMPATDDSGAAAVAAGAPRGYSPRVSVDDATDPLPAALRAGDGGVAVGDWARYEALEDRLGGDGVTSTWMAVAAAPGTLELQRRLDAGADTLATGVTLDRGADFAALLVAVANFSNPLQDLVLVSSSLDEGIWTFGDTQLAARRVSGLVECRMLSRSTLYPAVVELECVVSDEVPLLGVCELSLTMEVTYGERDGEPLIGRSLRRYVLQAHGRG